MARDVALVHFILMSGYRLFSLYYPLFLASQGFSLVQIGQAYLFIYLPIALGAPLAGFLTRIIHPAMMVAVGCSGYGAYAFGMLYFGSNVLVYAWQVMLGLSAALFFTASRALLMVHPGRNAEHSFSWFYNAPYWAGVVAPAIGALIIWRFGFPAVFQISLAVCVFAAAIALGMLSHPWKLTNGSSLWPKFVRGWRESFAVLFSKAAGGFIAVSFVVALVESLVHPFFILFLKDQIGMKQDQVLQFTAISAAAFSLFYFLVLKRRQNGACKRSIISGGLAAGGATVAFGFLIPVLSYVSTFFIEFVRGVGGFLAGTGRSALLAKELEHRPSEGGALDTIFSPLSIALGSFMGGYAINWFGYQWLFLVSGAAVLFSILILFVFNKENDN